MNSFQNKVRILKQVVQWAEDNKVDVRPLVLNRSSFTDSINLWQRKEYKYSDQVFRVGCITLDRGALSIYQRDFNDPLVYCDVSCVGNIFNMTEEELFLVEHSEFINSALSCVNHIEIAVSEHFINTAERIFNKEEECTQNG